MKKLLLTLYIMFKIMMLVQFPLHGAACPSKLEERSRARPSFNNHTIRKHGDLLDFIERTAEKIVLEELRRRGVGNLLHVNHAMSYFKALQKDFLITQFQEEMQKVRQKALDDMRFYFYLKDSQIKNMVFIMLAPYLQTISKNIR
ncbi:hypothetical protein KAT92_03310 [Candidatus Babeliales bacterium]|nr:hypothetical protein [Candidatus Babeliales bacterium]